MSNDNRPHFERNRYPVEYLAAHEVCNCKVIARRHGIGEPHPGRTIAADCNHQRVRRDPVTNQRTCMACGSNLPAADGTT